MEKILFIALASIIGILIFRNWLNNYEPTSSYVKTSVKPNNEEFDREDNKIIEDWNEVKIVEINKNKYLLVCGEQYQINGMAIVHYGVYYKKITIISSTSVFVLYTKYGKIIKVEKNNINNLYKKIYIIEMSVI